MIFFFFLRNIKARILLVSLLLNFPPFRTQIAQILSISTSILINQGSQMSSLAGGTTLYVQGAGFDPILANNQVYINNTIPAVLLSTTTAYLVIKTPTILNEGDYSLNLTIPGIQVQCLCDCRNYYRYSVTPEFYQVSPRSGIPGTLVTITGVPKTTLASNVQFWLAGVLCISSDTPTNDRSLNIYSSYSFSCLIPSELTPDYYNMTIFANTQGSALNYPQFTLYNPSNTPYVFEVVPSIFSISSNIGSPMGQRIFMTGVGFSSLSNPLLSSTPCQLIDWTSSKLHILIPPQNETMNQLSIQGRGLLRSVYSTNNMVLSDFENAYWSQNMTNNHLIAQSLEASFERTSTESGLYEVYTAYFYAPASGNYTFALSSDSYCEIFLSSIANSSDPNTLMKIITWNQSISTIPSTYNSISSQTLSLNASSLYQLQSFKPLIENPSYIRLSVETPLNLNSFRESIQVLKITYTPIREQLEIKIYNWKMGSFKIIVQGNDPITGAIVYYKVTQTLLYNISESNMSSVLQSQLQWGPVSLTRSNLNKTGGILNSSASSTDIAGFMFHINMSQYRDNYQGIIYLPKVQLLTFDTMPKISVVQVVTPTPPLTGSYSLLILGMLLPNINTNKSCLNDVLSQLPGYNRYVTCQMFGSSIENRSYVIKFSGITAPVPLIQVTNSNLQGGIPTIPPQISVSGVVNAGSGGFYSAIPDDLLMQGSSQDLQMNLYVNGILAGCPNQNCNYRINASATPILLQYNLTSQGLEMILDNYQNYPITPDTIDIEFALSPCTNLSIDPPFINCTLPTNPDGTLVIAGGSYKPLIHISGIGFCLYGSNILQTSIIFSITALNLLKGSIMGGQTLVISGNGFPPMADGLVVFIGTSIATVLNVTNTEMVILTQAQSQNNVINIYFNGVTGTFEYYEYSEDLTPVVDSLNPAAASPVQKGVILIEGSNFGNDTSNITVFLDKQDNSSNYQLSVINMTTDGSKNVITAILSGGRQGIYRVRVNVAGVGNSKPVNATANIFIYQLNIFSIHPMMGSISGGTLVSIYGQNFSPVLNQNQVFIGDSICNINFSNQSMIQCVTQSCPSWLIEKSLTVSVTQRIQETAVCQDNSNFCSFNYTMAITPQISLQTDVITAFYEDIITLEGQNLLPNTFPTDNAVISFFDLGGTQQAQVFSFSLSHSSISFFVPALISGLYQINILIPNKGFVLFTNFSSLSLNSPFSLKQVWFFDNPNLQFPLFNASLTKGGVYLALKTNGLIVTDLVYIQNSGYCYRITPYNPNYLVCRTRNLTKININYTIYIQRGSEPMVTCDSCIFNVSQLLSTYIRESNVSNTPQISNFSVRLSGSYLNFSNDLKVSLDLYDENLKTRSASFNGSVDFVNQSNLIASFMNIPAGKYLLNIKSSQFGFVYFQSLTAQTIFVNFKNFSIAPLQTGYLAGPLFTIMSENVLFPINFSKITICGINCELIDLSSPSYLVQCDVPPFISQPLKNEFPALFSSIVQNGLISADDISIRGDTPISTSNNVLMDGEAVTYYDSEATNYPCFLNFDFGANFTINLQKIVFSMNPRRAAPVYYGLIFQYSSDGIKFYNLMTLGPFNLRSGDNVYLLPQNITNIQVIRLQSPAQRHSSKCQLAEISFYGVRLRKSDSMANGSYFCDVTIHSIENSLFYFSNIVEYALNLTPVLQSLTPNMGVSEGGTLISIIGSNFGSDVDVLEVVLGGVQCIVQNVSDSLILCLTGPRAAVNENVEVEVLVNGNRGVLNGTGSITFRYIDLWSQSSTWGGEAPPREGDSVYIPAGQSVLVDTSVSGLNAVIIDGGTLIFQDQDLTFSAHYLICLQGSVLIGSEESPIQSHLTISMLGSSQDKQLPVYGSKVWALENSRLEVHGRNRDFYRTLLAQTAEKGQINIQISDAVDWIPGETILISSVTLDTQSEVRTIISISNQTITLDSPLQYQHINFIASYNGVDISRQSEVHLLSRNIQFQGILDQSSLSYGMHIMVSNRLSLVRLSNAEFFNVGQSSLLNRYPINIINLEDASQSYLSHLSIHNSFARAISLENSNYLRITDNLAYNVRGSAFVLASGIETANKFMRNVAIMTIQSRTLMNIDLSPAGFYVSNPTNVFINNSALHSDFAGFWLDFASVSKLDPNICPVGSPLTSFEGNMAAANMEYGLYIPQYIPRQFPCNPALNTLKDDPFADNQPQKQVIAGFKGFQNTFASLMVDSIGTVDFKNLLVLDTVTYGVMISDTSYTYIDGARLMNCLVVGTNNIEMPNIIGLVNPRTDNFIAKNLSFVNFSSPGSAAVFSNNNVPRTSKFQNISFDNVTQRIRLSGSKKGIFWDLDGSLTNQSFSTMLTGYLPHLMNIPQCSVANVSVFSSAILCNSSVRIRPLIFQKILGSDTFIGLPMKVLRIDNLDVNVSSFTSGNFSIDNMLNKENTWSLPFVTGYIYNIHWSLGTPDFTHIKIDRNLNWNTNDDRMLLRFNCSDYKDNYNIKALTSNGSTIINYTNVSKSNLLSFLKSKNFPKIKTNSGDDDNNKGNNNCNDGNTDDTKNNNNDDNDDDNNNEDNKNASYTNNDDDNKDAEGDNNDKTSSNGQNSKNCQKSSCNSGYYYFNNKTLDFILGLSPVCQQNYFLDATAILYPNPIQNATKNISNSTSEYIKPEFRFWSNASLWPSGHIPKNSEDVIINSYETVYLDIDTNNLGTLTIDGWLIFQSTSLLRLNAQRIWVRDGHLIAGNLTNPYIYPIEITLMGDSFSQDLIIDDLVDLGNKILAITGELNLISPYYVSGTSKRLSSSAKVGSSTISLTSSVDWKIGDQVVIGPSEYSPNQSEFKTIVSIANGGLTLVLDQPLSYFHYGGPDSSVFSNGAALDMRAVVGLLSRNIRIQGDQQDFLGCNILIYEYLAANGRLRTGKATLSGVEVRYCGQTDTDRSSIDVRYVKSGGLSMTNSSIHSAYGWGMNLVSSKNIVISESIVYDCQKYLIRLYATDFFIISNNLLIGAKARALSLSSDYYDTVAAVYIESPIPTPTFKMKSNIAQGCQGSGFIIPGSQCFDPLNGFMGNQANSMLYSGFIIYGNNSQCIELNNFSVFGCKIGVLSNFPATGIVIRNGVIAESSFGIYTTIVNEGIYNMILYDTLDFFAIARIDCPDCYISFPSNPQCSNQVAITLPVITIMRAQSFPIFGSSPMVLMNLTTDASFDQEFFIKNSRFHHFNIEYPELSSFCLQNLIFSMPPSSPDALATVYLSNTTSLDSSIDSFFQLSLPDPDDLPSCGGFNCSGEANWILSDLTGDFLNTTAQVIPQILGLKAYQCFPGPSSQWNGNFCSGLAFGILEFENAGPDQRLRPIAPVNVSSPQVSQRPLNQWKEWSASGNTRLSRFHAVVELNVSNNLTFGVSVPETMRFRLDSPQSHDFLFITIAYERPDIVQVWKGLSQVNSTNSSSLEVFRNYKTCGSNYYDSYHNTISFILTSEPDCDLIIQTVSYIQVSMHLQTSMDSFYTSTNIASFLDIITAFLGIDFARLRLVSVVSGSVYVNFQILEAKTPPSIDSSVFSNASSAQATLNSNFESLCKDFTTLIQKLNNGLNSSYGLSWPVLGIKAEPMISNPLNLTAPNATVGIINGSLILVAENKVITLSYTQESNGLSFETTMILSLVIPITLIIVALSCCCIKKDGVTIFRYLLNKILSKKSPSTQIHPRLPRSAGRAKPSLSQIVPDSFEDKVFDIEDSQCEKQSERTILPPSSNAMSPLKSSSFSKKPLVFRKEELGTIDTINSIKNIK